MGSPSVATKSSIAGAKMILNRPEANVYLPQVNPRSSSSLTRSSVMDDFLPLSIRRCWKRCVWTHLPSLAFSGNCVGTIQCPCCFRYSCSCS
jgi:hypothetical protein